MLDIVPVSLKEANAFVERYHRHHKPVVGHKFSIGATDGENIVGVAIVGRPVSRYLDDGMTLESKCSKDQSLLIIIADIVLLQKNAQRADLYLYPNLHTVAAIAVRRLIGVIKNERI